MGRPNLVVTTVLSLLGWALVIAVVLAVVGLVSRGLPW